MGLDQLGHLVQAAFHRVDVGQAQFRVDDLDIPHGVDAPFDVGNVVVGKAAHHLGDGVRVADMAEKLVAQAFAFRRAFDKARNVDEMHNGRRNLFAVEHLRQHVEPFVRHGDDAFVRLNGAERVIRRFGAGFRNGVEQGAFADVRQADNAHIQIGTHNNLSFIFRLPARRGRGPVPAARQFFLN